MVSDVKYVSPFSPKLRPQTLFTPTNVYQVRLQADAEKHKDL